MNDQAENLLKGSGWEIHAGRWQDSAPDVVDVLISDPPYNESTHLKGRRGSKLRRDDGSVRGIYGEGVLKSFEPVVPERLLDDISERVLRWVCIFCAVEQLGQYKAAAEDHGFEYVKSGLWVKTNPTPQFGGDRPAQWGDGLAFLYPLGKKGKPQRKRWNGIRGLRGAAAVFQVRLDLPNAMVFRHETHQGWYTGAGGRKRHDIRLHETQKPLGLMLPIVQAFSDKDEVVWDPYGGSMTTGVACLNTGRCFLGHELQNGPCDCLSERECDHDEKPYVRLGAERLRAAEGGLTVRDARAGQIGFLNELASK